MSKRWSWGIVSTVVITLWAGPAFAEKSAAAQPAVKQATTVARAGGWTIKSRSNAEGTFLACSMERFFTANKGGGRLRLNIIAWPESTIVLLRGNNGFLEGKGVGRFEIVSNARQLFSGAIRFENAEVLFSLNGRQGREAVAESAGWTISMDGRRLARFPMTGAMEAMAAVEQCSGFSPSGTQAVATTTAPPAEPAAASQPVTVPSATTNLGGSGSTDLKTIARIFSMKLGRPDFRVTQYEGGVLQWSYGDTITSAAATMTQQPQPAARYAAGLSLRPDECADSVLTLPMKVRVITGGEQAAVVSMCRGKTSVAVRHVHVVTKSDGTTYALNYETEAAPDGTDMPERSDLYADAFHAALNSVSGG